MIEVAIKNFVEFEFSKPPLYGSTSKADPKGKRETENNYLGYYFQGSRKETEYFDHL